MTAEAKPDERTLSTRDSVQTHTPGPWCSMVGQAVMAQGQLVAVVRSGSANAALIAAAPDLLSALKSFVDWHGPCHEAGCPEDDTCNCAARPINDAVNVAILKAEGRP